MMVLKYTQIVMPRRHHIIHVDEEDGIDTRVPKVMKRCSDQAAHLLEHVELQKVHHASALQEVVEGLAEVRSVCLVVIRDLLVTTGKSPHEIDQVVELKLVPSNEVVLC